MSPTVGQRTLYYRIADRHEQLAILGIRNFFSMLELANYYPCVGSIYRSETCNSLGGIYWCNTTNKVFKHISRNQGIGSHPVNFSFTGEHTGLMVPFCINRSMVIGKTIFVFHVSQFVHQGMPKIVYAVISHRDRYYRGVISQPKRHTVYPSAFQWFDDDKANSCLS